MWQPTLLHAAAAETCVAGHPSRYPFPLFYAALQKRTLLHTAAADACAAAHCAGYRGGLSTRHQGVWGLYPTALHTGGNQNQTTKIHKRGERPHRRGRIISVTTGTSPAPPPPPYPPQWNAAARAAAFHCIFRVYGWLRWGGRQREQQHFHEKITAGVRISAGGS